MMATARLLGAAHFGKLSLLYGTALAFEVFAGASLAVTCSKYVAELHRRDPARTGRIVALADVTSLLGTGIIGSTIALSASFLATNALAAPDLAEELRWSGLLVAVLSWCSVQAAILTGLEAFSSVAKVELLGGFAVFAAVPLGAISRGVGGAVAGLIVGHGVRALLLRRAVERELRHRSVPKVRAFPREELPVLWRFGLPAMLFSLVWAPANWAAMVITARQPNGHEAVGMFNAANQWLSLLLFVPNLAVQSAFPVLVERLGSGAVADAWRLLTNKVALIAVGVAPLALLIAVASPWIMPLYGPAYTPAWRILALVAATAWLAAPQAPLGNMLVAHELNWSWFLANLIWAATLVSAVYWWRAHGAFALAGGQLAAYLVRGTYASIAVYRLARTRGMW
jgi:O-antigen/teichoic acid export membrane protein